MDNFGCDLTLLSCNSFSLWENDVIIQWNSEMLSNVEQFHNSFPPSLESKAHYNETQYTKQDGVALVADS